MKRTLCLWVALLSHAAAAEFHLQNDGTITVNPRSARMTCQGVTRLQYPEFEIRCQGQLVSFFGASLRLKTPGDAPSTLKARKELVSIVALGEVVVTLSTDQSDRTVTCQRAVYIERDKRWLIDGTPWPNVHASR